MTEEQMNDMIREGEEKRQTEAEEKGFEPLEGYITVFLDGQDITRKFRFKGSDEEISESVGTMAKDMAGTLLSQNKFPF